jgi:putative Mg2+ transporter-C (MgtC) family protein
VDQTSDLVWQSIDLIPAAEKILLAALLGGTIGLERLWRGRPAGLRTNLMISVASCLFTILSIEGFPLRGSAQDTARIAAQIVTGVGFLGAGALIQSKGTIRGLTTAATIWLVAAIGMGVGAGAYVISIFTTGLAAAALVILNPISERIERKALVREKRLKAIRKARAKSRKEQQQRQDDVSRGEDSDENN